MIRALCLLMMLSAFVGPLRAQTPKGVIADISDRTIEIRYSFAGADLILFGAIQRESLPTPDADFDLIIEVIGPRRAITVRRKERIFGIWANKDAITFDNAPGYYALVATRPLETIADPGLQDQLGVGVDALGLVKDGEASDAAAFEAALTRQLSDLGLYRLMESGVEIRDGALFRTDIALPANVPVGQYQARVILLSDGAIISEHDSELTVSKSGVERAIYDYAHQTPFAYGLTAIVIALGAGWLAGAVSRQ